MSTNAGKLHDKAQDLSSVHIWYIYMWYICDYIYIFIYIIYSRFFVLNSCTLFEDCVLCIYLYIYIYHVLVPYWCMYVQISQRWENSDDWWMGEGKRGNTGNKKQGKEGNGWFHWVRKYIYIYIVKDAILCYIHHVASLMIEFRMGFIDKLWHNHRTLCSHWSSFG